MGNSISSFFGLSGPIGSSTPGQLVKGEGGIASIFGLPGPLGKIIKGKRVVTNAGNLSSATTTWGKFSGAMQLKSSLNGLFPGSRKMIKRNNIPQPGTERKPVYINNKNHKDSEYKSQAQIAKNLLTGKFRQNIIDQRGPTLPPFVPKGEFAAVPFFNKKMIEFRIEDVTRKNFINKFIDGITAKTKNDDKNEMAFARNNLIEFRDQFNKMIIPQVRICKDKISAAEERIKFIKSVALMAQLPPLNNKEEEDEDIKKLENAKKIFEKEFKGYTDFLSKYSNDPEKRENEIRKFFNLKEPKFFEINLFLTQNYWDFHTKIADKIKELQTRIDESMKNEITANEMYVRKIENIITEHTNFFNILTFLYTHIRINKIEAEKKADVIKLLKMQLILDKILQKNRVEYGYQNMLEQFGSKKNRYANPSFDFTEKINQIYGVREGGFMHSDANKEIEEEIKNKKLDINGLKSALNNLIEELYNKYGLKDPQTMKNMLPPITLHKSLNYKNLISILKGLVSSKKEDPNEYIKILKLELCIHEFMTRLNGSNYEKFKLEYDSRIIDKKLKRIIPDFDSQVAKLKAEISGKSVEQLKTETNELLEELRKYFKDFKNSNKIGNITNAISKNTANLGTQVPINLANLKNPVNSANQVPKKSNNMANVTSTRNGNGNQSLINKNELPPFKNNLQQQLLLQ